MAMTASDRDERDPEERDSDARTFRPLGTYSFVTLLMPVSARGGGRGGSGTR